MTASVVEFISGLVCFVAIIALFGFLFKCIDVRIRVDIRSNQAQLQNVNQKVNAKDLITMFDKLTGFYDKMFMDAGSAGVYGGVDGTILPSYLLPLFEIVKKDRVQLPPTFDRFDMCDLALPPASCLEGGDQSCGEIRPELKSQDCMRVASSRVRTLRSEET